MQLLLKPAWLICFLLFLLHQFSQKVMSWAIPFADNYLDCLLCMPIFLTFLLIERRFLLQQSTSYSFPFWDTMAMTLFLAIIFEELFPLLADGFTKDYWDYVCYFIGGVFFYFFINVKIHKHINQ